MKKFHQCEHLTHIQDLMQKNSKNASQVTKKRFVYIFFEIIFLQQPPRISFTVHEKRENS